MNELIPHMLHMPVKNDEQKIINIIAYSYKTYRDYCAKHNLKKSQTRYIGNKAKAMGIEGEVLVVTGGWQPNSDFEEVLPALQKSPHVILKWV